MVPIFLLQAENNNLLCYGKVNEKWGQFFPPWFSSITYGRVHPCAWLIRNYFHPIMSYTLLLMNCNPGISYKYELTVGKAFASESDHSHSKSCSIWSDAEYVMLTEGLNINSVSLHMLILKEACPVYFLPPPPIFFLTYTLVNSASTGNFWANLSCHANARQRMLWASNHLCDHCCIFSSSHKLGDGCQLAVRTICFTQILLQQGCVLWSIYHCKSRKILQDVLLENNSNSESDDGILISS